MTKPLVSILTPAYNAADTIAETIHSAIVQSWPCKEIIVVDDGSTDRSVEIARSFGSRVRVVSVEHRGGQVARNHAYSLSQGDYIQWLDSDDLLAPDKIERQLAALRESDSKRILLSCPTARFYFRTSKARLVHNSLWQDLSPFEWLLRHLGENAGMHTTNWLTSRELAEAAGPWDERLLCNQDPEYFARVIMASEGIRFVPDTRVYYRRSGPNRVSFRGRSYEKNKNFLVSMKLLMKYLRSLEESERVRKACLKYLQDEYYPFYRKWPDIDAELESLAAELGGKLKEPRLRPKFAWIRPILGWKVAQWAQESLPTPKEYCTRQYDRLMHRLRRD
jgi:glycosyltransferase involved in cell wall biosynthesis